MHFFTRRRPLAGFSWGPLLRDCEPSMQPAALLTYERAALGGGDDEAQGDGRLGDAGAGHQALQILLELGADQGERLQWSSSILTLMLSESQYHSLPPEKCNDFL